MKKKMIKIIKKIIIGKNTLSNKKYKNYIYYFINGKWCIDGDTLK